MNILEVIKSYIEVLIVKELRAFTMKLSSFSMLFFLDCKQLIKCHV